MGDHHRHTTESIIVVVLDVSANYVRRVDTERNRSVFRLALVARLQRMSDSGLFFQFSVGAKEAAARIRMTDPPGTARIRMTDPPGTSSLGVIAREVLWELVDNIEGGEGG